MNKEYLVLAGRYADAAASHAHEVDRIEGGMEAVTADNYDYMIESQARHAMLARTFATVAETLYRLSNLPRLP